MGRESRHIRLEVLSSTTQAEVEECLALHRQGQGICYSDESQAYNHVATPVLDHRTVCHSDKEWARDDDQDGIREVHINTCEGLWTELRNYLRRFKGVSKHYLHLYVAMFEWMHNLKKVSSSFIQALVFSPIGT